MKREVRKGRKSYITEDMAFRFLLLDLEVRILHANRVGPDPNWTVPEHSHTCFELHVIPEGQGFITIEGHDLDVSGGEIYITGPYIKHTQITNPLNPMTECCLRFELLPVDPDVMDTGAVEESHLLKKYLSHCYPHVFQDRYRMDIKFEELFAEMERQEVGYRIRVQSILLSIMVDMLRLVHGWNEKAPSEGEERRRVRRIIDFINNHYMEPIRIEDVSRILFLCPRQINRLLRRWMNATFHSLLIARRLESARWFISEGRLSIEESAIRSGFSSSNYMYHVFKKNGLPTPAAMRGKDEKCAARE